MKEYRELSSLCFDLGYSERALYTLSNTIDKHYHTASIPKGNGEMRTLHIPDKFLKCVQKSIADNILKEEPISKYASAYRTGGSTKVNAQPHVGAKKVMKCDIRKYFDHITYPMIKEKVFPESRYAEEIRILLSILCVDGHITPQGAPTSPFISNIILRDFDDRVGAWCEKGNITYTRYCDDMTFSGNFNPIELKELIKKELFKEGFFINPKKTVVLKNGQRKTVTGLVVNDKLSVPKEYKKEIRKEIYYCKRYGIDSHLKRTNSAESEGSYRMKMLGKINYVLSIEPHNEEMVGYRTWLTCKDEENCLGVEKI